MARKTAEKADGDTRFDDIRQLLDAVFAKLAEVKLQFTGLAPGFDVRPPNESPEDKKQSLLGRLHEFQNAFDVLLEVVEHQSAFYPPHIYHGLSECLGVAGRETVEIQTSGDDLFQQPWYHRRNDNLQKFLVNFNSVSDTIRERVSRLAIVPGAPSH
jgi:hypothetical protein